MAFTEEESKSFGKFSSTSTVRREFIKDKKIYYDIIIFSLLYINRQQVALSLL